MGGGGGGGGRGCECSRLCTAGLWYAGRLVIALQKMIRKMLQLTALAGNLSRYNLRFRQAQLELFYYIVSGGPKKSIKCGESVAHERCCCSEAVHVRLQC